MTQYYDMFLAVNTRRGAPQHIIETLKYLTRKEEYDFQFPPDFPMLLEDDDNENNNILRSPDEHLDFDRFFGSGFLIFRACNWYGDFYRLTMRIDHIIHFSLEWYYRFLKWLAPHVEPYEGEGDEFVGFIRRGNFTQGHPTLLYFGDNKVFYRTVTDETIELTEENLDDIMWKDK